MNRIQAEIDKSDYEIYPDFLNIKIDGEWLDEKLEELYPGKTYKGLIPTLLFAMETDVESKVVWNRILPDIGTTTICPILMCPDDCDFSCTIIDVQIERRAEKVSWNKLGINITSDWQPDSIGSEVEWFDKIPALEFSIEDYLKLIKDFETRFKIDRENWKTKREEFR